MIWVLCSAFSGFSGAFPASSEYEVFQHYEKAPQQLSGHYQN